MTDPFLMRVQPGVQANADGGQTTVRGDRQGGICTSDMQPRYMELAVRGQIFSAANVAAQAVSVALATTYTGLVVSNPPGSGKNLVLLGGQYALSVAPAAIASLHLIAGFAISGGVSAHTTPLAAPGIQSTLINGAANSVAKADSAATIVSPYYLAGLGSGFTAAALYSTTPLWIDFGGMFIIPPGGYVAWGALTAVTGFGTLAWAELPQ